ncbi:MAG: GGDEF domain-containing protein [Psychrilyobacter sp.]|uniref:GGDEF domain-containing protein n=1 Tax=Psychrilyobacter sp. TaxID=2586924 RepID=UPI003C712602
MKKIKKSDIFKAVVKDFNVCNDHPEVLKLLIEHRSQIAHNKIQRNLFKSLINDYVKLTKKLEDNLEYVTHLSETDHLTKAYNRLKFNEVIKVEILKSKRYKTDLSILMFDIDFFKKINDKYGHDKGDLVLVEISKLVKELIREIDIFCRWGGEEFMVLLPNTSLKFAVLIAERIRKSIHNLEIEKIEKVSCSFGVVSFDFDESLDAFIKRVDNKLYTAKNNGRNRVEY